MQTSNHIHSQSCAALAFQLPFASVEATRVRLYASFVVPNAHSKQMEAFMLPDGGADLSAIPEGCDGPSFVRLGER